MEAVAAAPQRALEAHLRAPADRLHLPQLRFGAADLERLAAGVVPRQTALVKADGYRGWRAPLDGVSDEVKQQFPVARRAIASTSELQLLIDGRNSALDIRDQLDAQYSQASDLQAILNHLEILRAAGLVEWSAPVEASGR